MKLLLPEVPVVANWGAQGVLGLAHSKGADLRVRSGSFVSFSVSVFDVRMMAIRERLLCSSLHIIDSHQAAVHADVENQSKLTHQARPGSGETQLSAVRTVSAAGFGTRTLVMAPSHVAVDVTVAFSKQFPNVCSSERSRTTTCRRFCKIVGATCGGAPTTRLRECSEIGLADDAARSPLEVLAGFIAAI